MKREIRIAEKVLLVGLSLIFLFMLLHDWIQIGSLNDVQAVKSDGTMGELITVTFINAGQILLLLVVTLLFVGKTYPLLIKLWLVIHQTSIFAGAVWAWWIPYLFGYGAEERIQRYEDMFGNTHSFLPVMNGIVPNTIHTLFHITLLTCIILTIYISLTARKTKESKVNTEQSV